MYKNIYIRGFIDMVIGFENGCVVWLLCFLFLFLFFIFDEEQGYRKETGHGNNPGRHSLPFSVHCFEQLKWGQISIPQVLEPVGKCRWPLVTKQSVFYYSHESWECLWKFIVKCMGLQSPDGISFLALGFLCTAIPSHTPMIILGLAVTWIWGHVKEFQPY